MNRALLEKPFAAAQIRQRKGRNGFLDYVEGHSVIQRLNDAFDGRWSFDIVHHEIRDDEVLVIGRLTAEEVSKTSFGGNQITRDRASGQPLSLGDDLKAATTDALKKCATLLGVGLHLYGEKAHQDSGLLVQSERTANSRRHVDDYSRDAEPTARQLEAIQKIAQAKGLDAEALEQLSLQLSGRGPDALSRTEAAGLIKELSNLRRRAA